MYHYLQYNFANNSYEHLAAMNYKISEYLDSLNNRYFKQQWSSCSETFKYRIRELGKYRTTKNFYPRNDIDISDAASIKQTHFPFSPYML